MIEIVRHGGALSVTRNHKREKNMKTTQCLLVMMLVGTSSLPCLASFTYSQNFDAVSLTLAESGWTSTAVVSPSVGLVASLGYGGTTCLQTSSNTWAPSVEPTVAGTRPDSSVLFGDVATQFGGSGITVDYDVYSQTTAADRLTFEFRSASSTWQYVAYAAGSSAFYQQWAHVTVAFESSWTRAQAVTAGWTETNSSGESFATSLTAVTGWNLWQDNISEGGKQFQLRADNITFSTLTIPEPASLALLGLAAVTLLRRRR